MAKKQESLKLGKGAAFVKSRLKRLRQEPETWEADFRALPKPLSQSTTHYAGLVLSQPDGFLLADEEIEGSPSVNDLASLLADAMRRPLTEYAHRPNRLLLRGHQQWRELFPHLKELGIEVVVQSELPLVEVAFQELLEHLGAEKRKSMTKPSVEQVLVEMLFPFVAKWINGGYGWIEIGDQESFGFVARALDYGGLVFEDDKSRTLAEAMASLDEGLAKWFKEDGKGKATE